MTEIASLASRNLVGDLRKPSISKVSLARPSRYGQETVEGGREERKSKRKGEKGRRQRSTTLEIFQAIPVKANVEDMRSKV